MVKKRKREKEKKETRLPGAVPQPLLLGAKAPLGIAMVSP